MVQQAFIVRSVRLDTLVMLQGELQWTVYFVPVHILRMAESKLSGFVFVGSVGIA